MDTKIKVSALAHRISQLRNRLLQVALLGLFLLSSSPLLAEDGPGVPDREKVIDLPRVQKVLEESTALLKLKIAQSQLKECFAAVNKLGEAEDPDLYQMAESLDDLELEIETFLKDWDQVTGPLHDGRAAIGDTIADIRNYLVQGPSKERKQKLLRRLESYEGRLQDLAVQISREKDPRQSKRLKSQFAILLKLKNQLAGLIPGAGGEQLQQSRLRIYGPLITALSNLDGQIVAAGYHSESTKLSLEGALDSVVFHRGVVAGLIEVREFTAAVGAFTDGEGPQADFSELLEQIAVFSRAMENATGRLAGGVTERSEDLAQTMQKTVDTSDIDVDAEVKRYAERARAAAESEQE